MGLIYIAKNIKNGKLYVGKTSKNLKDRIIEHQRDSKRHDTLFYKSIRKHGFDSFVWKKLDEAESEEELNNLEKLYIDMFSTCIRNCGYNSTHGGDGVIMNNESRLKMSNTKKGKTSPKKGVKMSDSAYKSLMDSRVGIWERNKHPMIGKKQTEESKEKMKKTKLERQVVYHKKCSCCGKDFTALVKFALYCSNSCNIKTSRSRRKEK